MKIKFNDLSAQWQEIETDALPAVLNVLRTGNYILGEQVKTFEEAFATWNNNQFSVGVANGTDAIKVAIRALNLTGTSIFYVPANTYIASVLGIIFSNSSASIRLVDCDEYFQIDTAKLEESIVKWKNFADNHVIMPVHLYGHSCDMLDITRIASEHDCTIIEDCSQAHGTLAYNSQKVGTFGTVSAFSLYPGKNLGAAGDAGVITTNEQSIYDSLLKLRNLGSTIKYQHDIIGWNSRLDTMQACILTEKLKKLDLWNFKKSQVANIYNAEIIESEFIKLPKVAPYCKKHTYHLYPILTTKRDALQAHLHSNGIPTLIHYPIPMEESGALQYLKTYNENTRTYSKQLLSLPMHPFLTENEIAHIVSSINKFKG